MTLNVHIRRNSKPRKLKTVRVDRIEIRNQSDTLYYTVQCKSVDGVPVLYLADVGKR
jgi:hypothetical protein